MALRRSQVEEKAAVLLLAQIIVQRQSAILTDAEALTAPQAFEQWGPGMKYGKDQIIWHAASDKLYRLMNDVEKSQAHQPPGGKGMLAVYRPIEVSATGTIDDPIPYTYGMDCRDGLYYSYGGKLYLCKADMLPCIWPPDTAGMWQWEEVAVP